MSAGRREPSITTVLSSARRLALARHKDKEALRSEVERLEETLAERQTIDKAKAILMQRVGSMSGPSSSGPITAQRKVAAPRKVAASAPASAEDRNPAGAIAQCKDGTYSHAKARTGACSRHGGVGKWS